MTNYREHMTRYIIGLGYIENPNHSEWTYDFTLTYENNMTMDITIIDENLFPTGHYELTFDFFRVSIEILALIFDIS